MKKLLALALALCMIIVISGCGLIQTAKEEKDPNNYYVILKAMDPDIPDLKARLNTTRDVLLERLKSCGYTTGSVTVISGDRLRVEIQKAENADEGFTLIAKPILLKFLDLDGKVILTGDRIEQASAGKRNGKYVVNFKLLGPDAEESMDATLNLKDQPIEIMINGTIITSSAVNVSITEGKGCIDGTFTMTEAQQLATKLQSGALPLALKIIDSGAINSQKKS